MPDPVGDVGDRRALCVSWGDRRDPERQVANHAGAEFREGSLEESIRLELGFRARGSTVWKKAEQRFTFREPGSWEGFNSSPQSHSFTQSLLQRRETGMEMYLGGDF